LSDAAASPAAPTPRRPGLAGRARAWLGQDLPRWLERTFIETPAVPVAIEVDASQVILAAAARERRQARPRVTALRALPLAEGLVRPSAVQPNVSDPAALAEAVRRLFDGAPAPKGVSLILPDAVAKVTVLDLETLPRSRREALELVRFRLKKSVPYRIEEAQVDFAPCGSAGGRVRVLAVVAHRPVLEQYTQAVEAMGVQAGLVTLSTLALCERGGLAGDSAAGDSLVANLTPHALTLAVFRGGEIAMFRSKALAGPEEADAAERRQAARREWQATVAYYQERLEGKGFASASARLIGWQPSELLAPDESERLQRIDIEGWAEPAPEVARAEHDGALFAPALALALRGAA
jgi:type IV pilus assembly protein PilM